MLTRAQMRTFQDLKEGKLTPKQKADFYYRISKILKKNLRSIKEMTVWLDEMPDSYLEKIDFCSAATDSLILLEKLIERLEPYPATGSLNGDSNMYSVVRIFQVEIDNPLPNVILSDKSKPIASIALSYVPTESEVKLSRELRKFEDLIGESALFSTRHKIYTAEEFSAILEKWKKKPKFEARMAPAPVIEDKLFNRVNVASNPGSDT